MPLTCTNEDHLDLTEGLAGANVLPNTTAARQGRTGQRVPPPHPGRTGDKRQATRPAQGLTSQKDLDTR
jgi:hypothetical protein